MASPSKKPSKLPAPAASAPEPGALPPEAPVAQAEVEQPIAPALAETFRRIGRVDEYVRIILWPLWQSMGISVCGECGSSRTVPTGECSSHPGH